MTDIPLHAPHQPGLCEVLFKCDRQYHLPLSASLCPVLSIQLQSLHRAPDLFKYPVRAHTMSPAGTSTSVKINININMINTNKINTTNIILGKLQYNINHFLHLMINNINMKSRSYHNHIILNQIFTPHCSGWNCKKKI